MISTTLTSSRSLSARSEEIQKLAGDIDEFVYEYDTYEYKDVVEDREDNIASIIRSLECDGLGERCYLSGIIHEDDPNEETTKEAAALLNRIYAVLNITNMEVQSL